MLIKLDILGPIGTSKINYSSMVVKRISAILQILILVIIISNPWEVDAGEDYYQLLGITKSADNREIRKAFKKLALIHHPDKNKDDPKANEMFVKINRAYEVLKDEETRKKYDLHGEEGLKDDFERGQSWHSWNYYEESFGIYDDDPQIITLSRSEFEASVTNSPFIWFINFYSPQCSHCHHIAPEWRSMARELENIIRVGAVNCEEDWVLCREQRIHGFPSLILYPKKQLYEGKRTSDALTEFVLSNLPNKVIKITEDFLKSEDTLKNIYWLISFCSDKSDCQFEDSLVKLAIALDGLTKVSENVKCDKEPELCRMFGINDKAIRLYKNVSNVKDFIEISYSQDPKDIISSVLHQLPGLEELDETKFKLPPLLKNISTGQINCKIEKNICSNYQLSTFPKFLVFRDQDSYEVYHGRISAHDVATFALESLTSHLNTLSPAQFEEAIKNQDKPWLVDFYAPWCPPCMNFMPEIRKTSKTLGSTINFGTVDCTIHSTLCRKYNIRSYPTLILYNQSSPHQFFGNHKSADLIDFIQDTLNPPVESLTATNFGEKVLDRDSETIYLVDFYAPWCRPCQEFAPVWRKIAKLMKPETNVKVADVNCQDQLDLCSSQGVKTYPTIRLYPSKRDSRFKEPFFAFNGYNRDIQSVRVWIYYYLPTLVRSIDSPILFEKLLNSKYAYLVDYYAPWCAHCQTFAPDFEIVSKKLKEDGIKTAKIDCQEHVELCSKANVRAYPTLRFYPGAVDGETQGPHGIDIDTYHVDSIISQVKKYVKPKIIKDEL
uniref:DnaJ homolog subfamily C member 10 n=1 Tax=Tetranychus urticae TaxID=32264 RepID=T1KBH9_TETUR